MHTVYIIKSSAHNRYYVGVSEDVGARLKKHNYGSNRSTRPYRPWNIVYTESYDSKQVAIKRERQIKSYKSGDAFKKLIGRIA